MEELKELLKKDAITHKISDNSGQWSVQSVWNDIREAIQGTSIATTIGRATGVIVQFWLLFRGGKHIQVKVSQIYLDMKIMLGIIRTFLGGVGQMIVAMTSWIFLMRMLLQHLWDKTWEPEILTVQNQQCGRSDSDYRFPALNYKLL